MMQGFFLLATEPALVIINKSRSFKAITGEGTPDLLEVKESGCKKLVLVST